LIVQAGYQGHGNIVVVLESEASVETFSQAYGGTFGREAFRISHFTGYYGPAATGIYYEAVLGGQGAAY
jgi:hypothetical protein